MPTLTPGQPPLPTRSLNPKTFQFDQEKGTQTTSLPLWGLSAISMFPVSNICRFQVLFLTLPAFPSGASTEDLQLTSIFCPWHHRQVTPPSPAPSSRGRRHPPPRPRRPHAIDRRTCPESRDVQGLIPKTTTYQDIPMHLVLVSWYIKTIPRYLL